MSQDSESVNLPEKAAAHLSALIDSPPEPSEALKKAAASFKGSDAVYTIPQGNNMELARLEEERAAEQSAQKLEPHQQRVVNEKAELDKKVEAINNFIEYNPTFHASFITDGERARLVKQRIHMTEYSKVLGERIAAFDPVVYQKEVLDQLTSEAQSTGEYS
jgi:hypothetical protein